MVELTIHFYGVASDVLDLLIVGEKVKLWTAPDQAFIYFFARRTCGGQGRIAKLPKDRVPILTKHLTSTTAAIKSIDGTKCTLLCEIDDEAPPF